MAAAMSVLPPDLPVGRNGLAPYACDWRTSRGRLHDEPASPTRSAFQRDRDRIIHSAAFRRLMHKTQAFVHHEQDHFRTRLTHTIEVGQIARSLARALRVDEDLTEALALVHDIGHTPFGHAGERVLEDRLRDAGGFEHNAQALKIVTELERRYAGFDGLNLSWETLEGLVKHNGPLTDDDGTALGKRVPAPVRRFDEQFDLRLWSWPSVEAQCAAIADDIAYDGHDLEDSLRAGHLTLDRLDEVPLWSGLLAEVRSRYPTLDVSRAIHEVVRRQITMMVEDVITASQARLEAARVESADDVRRLGHAVVGFSPDMAAKEMTLKRFMFDNVYRSPAVMDSVEAAEAIIADLFDGFMDGRATVPDEPEWRLDGLSLPQRKRRIADYIAGFTDRFAVREHRRWFDHARRLR